MFSNVTFALSKSNESKQTKPTLRPPDDCESESRRLVEKRDFVREVSEAS